MKKLFYFLSMLVLITGLFVKTASADIGVTVTNNTNTTPALAVSYTSLALALADLNAVTAMSGPVTLTLAAGSSETAPVTGFTIGSSTLNPVLNATNTVTIVRSGGTVTLNAGVGTATPASAAPDGILKIVGADYITIDGLTFTDGNTANPATMEFGIALFKRSAADGAQYNIIQNCTFNMQRVNNATGAGPMVDGSVGINVVNSIPTAAGTSLTPTTSAGTNSYNKFYGNILYGGNYGIVLSGYAASSPFTLGDTGNDIGGGFASFGNGIYNFGGGDVTNPSSGIRANNQWSVNISYNTINNNNGSGVNHATTLRGLYAQAGTSAGATITYNTVTINGGGTTTSVYGIDNAIGSTASSNTVDISYNTVTGSYTTATTGAFYGIQNTSTAATVNVTHNTVSNISTAGTGSLYALASSAAAVALNYTYNTIGTLTKTGIGAIYAMYVSSNPTVTAQNNLIDGLLCTAAASTANIAGYYNASTSVVENVSSNIIRNFSSTGTSTLYGIYIGTATGNKTLQNNQVYNFTKADGGTMYGINMSFGSTDDISNNQVHDFNMTAATSGTIYGIRIAAGTLNNVYQNNIYALSVVAGTTGIVYGFYIATGTTNNVFRNKVCNLSCGSSGPTLYGAYLISGTTNNFYNNLIGDLRTPAANAAIPLAGIYVGGGTTAKIYDNTVYLNATSSGALFGSAALYAATATPNLDMRNNILVNTSTPAGATGFTAAYRRSTTTLTSYLSTSNYNYYYAGTPSPTNLVFYDGTNSDQTLAAFQARVAPRDAASVTSATGPSFLSTTCGDATFLHITPNISSVIESGGSAIATYDNDFDGDIRQGSAGYPAQVNGGGSSPDIGADEYDGIPSYSCTSPNPGTTIASANSICLGQSVTLSLQNAVPGTGITYQWQSSPNNGTYTNIAGANTAQYFVAPTASIYYRCVVTCQNGPSSVNSVPVQITFNNTITSTTPGSRCGTGSVSLAATGSAGTISWYAAGAGGSPIGTGSPFTTPIISATTSYYVSAETFTAGNAASGAGASTSATYSNPFYSLWSNIHTQHLIKASELTAAGLGAGNITSVALDVTSVGTLPMIDLSVKIAATTATSMSAFLSPTFTTVFTSASFMPVSGLNVLTFTPPFTWDGSSNIVLEFCHGNGASSATMSRTVKSDVTSYVSSIKTHVSAATAAATICANTTTNLLTYSERPQFTFAGQVACSSPRSAVVATVINPPVLTVSANKTVCNNEVATIQVTSAPLSDFDTYIWSPATNLFTDITCLSAYDGISTATTLYAKSASAVVTTYTCTATKTSSGCVNTSQSVLTVLPANPTVTAQPPNICVSGATLLSLNPATGWGNATFQWQDSPDNTTFTDIGGANGTTYTTKAITSTTYYKLIIKNSAGVICSEPQVTVTVTNPQVVNPVPGTRCGTGTVQLGASVIGGTLSWYAAPTGGNPLGSGTTFTTPAISSTTSFYVDALAPGSASYSVGKTLTNGADGTSTGAGLVFDASVPFTLNSVYVYPIGTGSGTVTIQLQTSASAVLQTTTVTLTGTATPGIKTQVPLNFDVPAGTGLKLMFSAYTSPITGLIRDYTTAVPATAFPYTVPGVMSITGATLSPYYYFFYDWNISVGCRSARTEVIATVTPPPALTITGDQTICNAEIFPISVTSLVSNFDTYTWSPVTSLFTDPACTSAYDPLTTPSATSLYVKSTTGGILTYSCTGTNSSTGCVNTAQAIITVLPQSPAIVATPASICVSGSAVLNVSPATGWGTATFQWQDSPDNITFTSIAGATTQTYTTPTISATRYYQVLVKNGAGASCSAIQFTLPVNNPQITGVFDGTRCGTGSVVLSATGSGVLKWYNVATGGLSIGTGSPFNTPVISATTDYWVESSGGSGGTVSVGPVSPTAQGGTIATQTIAWNVNFTTFAATSIKTVDIFPIASGQAGVIKVLTGSTTSGTVLATINYTTTVSGGATAQTIQINCNLPTPGSYNLYTSTLPSSGITRNTSGAVYPYISSVANITGNGFDQTYFMGMYNWQFESECVSPRQKVTAYVTAPPAITPSANPTSVCAGSASTLDVTSGNAGYSYTWTPGNLSGAQQTVNPEITTTYTVTASDGTCATTGTTTVTVLATPSPIVIVPVAPVIAPGAIQQLTAVGGTLAGGAIVGNGVTTNTATTYPSPYTNYYGGTKHQMLIKASELAAAGLAAGVPINSISFKVTEVGSAFSGSLNNFQIDMGLTSATALTNTAFLTGLTNVFAPATVAIAVGTITHTLNTPFIWDGTSNIVVQTSYSNANTGTSSTYVLMTNTDPGFMSTNWYRADAATAAVVLAATTPTSSSNARPNMVLGFASPSSMIWTPYTSLYTDGLATVAYNGENLAVVYSKPATTITYTVTATSGITGCTRAQSATVTIAATPAVTGTVTNVTGCFGNSNGAISTNVTGGVSPYGYAWSNAATTASLTGITAGTYTVTVTDAASSSVVGSWTVTQPAQAVLSAVVTNANCPAIHDGVIDLTVTGGTPGYNYVWSNGGDSQDISALAAGVYTVTVTDSHGCAVSGSWTVGLINAVCDNTTVTGTVSTTVCYNATTTITVAGSATTFIVSSPGGNATFIAGNNILFEPGTHVESGAYMHAYISNTYCLNPASPITAAVTGQDEPQLNLSHAYFTLYPNPTSGNFTLVQKGDRSYRNVKVEVYSMNGGKVLSEEMIGEKSHEFNFSGIPTGLYFVKVVADDYVETIKLIKSR
ncbi:MAG: T9SS type A sorting domain-containing protein [Bacteroidales bacterium]